MQIFILRIFLLLYSIFNWGNIYLKIFYTTIVAKKRTAHLTLSGSRSLYKGLQHQKHWRPYPESRTLSRRRRELWRFYLPQKPNTAWEQYFLSAIFYKVEVVTYFTSLHGWVAPGFDKVISFCTLPQWK